MQPLQVVATNRLHADHLNDHIKTCRAARGILEAELDDCDEQEEGNEQHQQRPDFDEVAAHHQDQILSAEADQRSESSRPFCRLTIILLVLLRHLATVVLVLVTSLQRNSSTSTQWRIWGGDGEVHEPPLFLRSKKKKSTLFQ